MSDGPEWKVVLMDTQWPKRRVYVEFVSAKDGDSAAQEATEMHGGKAVEVTLMPMVTK